MAASCPQSKYKIEVIEDRAPRVAFEEPGEALEVHPIAEVKHRVRVADDFGLTRAGIVFQFGEGDEQTLVLQDFAKGAAKARTTAALEEMLLLEKLAATPRDSVTYYAFAEDNNPERARADRDRAALHRHPPVQAGIQDRASPAIRRRANRTTWRPWPS